MYGLHYYICYDYIYLKCNYLFKRSPRDIISCYPYSELILHASSSLSLINIVLFYPKHSIWQFCIFLFSMALFGTAYYILVLFLQYAVLFFFLYKMLYKSSTNYYI